MEEDFTSSKGGGFELYAVICCLSLFVNCIKLWPIPPHEVLEAWPLATVVGMPGAKANPHPQFCMHESSRRRLHHGGDHGKQHRNQAEHNLGSSCLLQEWNRDHHIHGITSFHQLLGIRGNRFWSPTPGDVRKKQTFWPTVERGLLRQVCCAFWVLVLVDCLVQTESADTKCSVKTL